MELEEGDVLEGSTEIWEVSSFLGRGKCCSVYEAICQNVSGPNGKRAAVKVYKKDDKYASAGMNEANLLRMLHQDGDEQSMKGKMFIVNIIDVFHCEGHLCLLNTLLSYSLHYIFALNGCHGNGLPLYMVQKCCRDLACGLEYLKQKSVVHGDVKPSNIMWNSTHEVFQFVDFGLGFVEGKQPAHQIQSPGFQGPEVQHWNKNITNTPTKATMCSCCCDIWSMACVLHLLYTGEHFIKPNEELPLVCNNCAQGKLCKYELRIRDVLSSHWTKLKDGTQEQHGSFVDLLIKMLTCKPGDRITPGNITSHSFLELKSMVKYPSLSDLLILPTRVLQLTNMFDKLDELNDTDDYEDFIDDIRQECEGYGTVKSIWVPFLKDTSNRNLGGKVFVEFSDSRDCELAQRGLSGRTFNNKTVIASYFPLRQYQQRDFY